MKIIKIFFQSLFKKFFQLLFKIFYGKIIYKKNNLKHKNILINKVKNKEVKNLIKILIMYIQFLMGEFTPIKLKISQ